MNKEIKSLTGIRGIAALCIVFLHYFEIFNLFKHSYIGNLLSNSFIAVDLFFLLSAFVMCLAYTQEFQKTISINSYIVFIKKRFVRIYPAYFFWVCMILSFDFIKFNFDYTKMVVNFLLVQNFFTDAVISSVFWSLCSEWILYLIFPFLFSMMINNIRFKYLNICLILICIVGIYLLPSINNYIIDLQRGLTRMPPANSIIVVWGSSSILRCFFSYVIGINLFLLIKELNVNYGMVGILKYCSIIGILVVSYFGKSSETYALIMICSIVLMAALYFGREKHDSFFASKTVYFLGKISYSMYLCHMFILVSMTILAKKFLSIQIYNSTQTYLLLGSLILLIPVSYFSYKFIEVKAGDWLKSKLFVKRNV